MSKAEQDLEIARRFAVALDEEDYTAAESLLSAASVYALRGVTHAGPAAIVASYKGNGDAAQAFDEISYGSAVRVGDDGWMVIEFWDELVHRGRRHRHVCEQWVRVEGDLITRIEHRDLEGEVERLKGFKEWAGVGE